jgi:hypothetical protein
VALLGAASPAPVTAQRQQQHQRSAKSGIASEKHYENAAIVMAT